MVNMHNRQATFAKVPYPGRLGGVLPVGPANELGMLSDYVAPDQRFVTCPNQDVVYGAGFMQLAKEPAVLQVPDFGDRFWVYQIVDQRTDSFARMGKQYQTKPGLYLLVGPDWNGEKPEGIAAVYRSPTNIGAVFPRIFMDDIDEDRAAVQPLVDQIMMYPLSKYTGKAQTIDWSEAKTIPQPESSGDAETAWVVPEMFFEELPAVMDEVEPLPGEEALYAWIRQVLEAAEKDPALKKALVDTAVATEKEILKPMFEFRGNGVDAGNGWRTQKNAAQFGTGYFQRTATAKGNMFSNMPSETMYFGADYDSNGDRINGSKTYTVTFPKGQLPPVNGFWSLTLYNQQHFFHPNQLTRFSLGTKNKDLKLGPDGSLTIYVQPNAPGADKESNWLPAPAEDYSLYIRAYWPMESIVNGEWVPPTIKSSKP